MRADSIVGGRRTDQGAWTVAAYFVACRGCGRRTADYVATEKGGGIGKAWNEARATGFSEDNLCSDCQRSHR